MAAPRRENAPEESESPAPRPASGPRFMGGMSQLKAQSRTPVLVGSNAAEAPYRVLEGAWYDPNHSERAEAAITHDSAKALGVGLGDEVLVSGGRDSSPTKLRIGAILEQPARLPPPKFMVGLPPSRDAALRGGPPGNAVFVPMVVAEQCAGSPARISNLGITLKSGMKVDDFLAAWAPKLAQATPPLEARTHDTVSTEADNSTSLAGVRARLIPRLASRCSRRCLLSSPP